ncbi:hypothetical protein N7492_008652 [Penicillium capsulatum]|uniref:NACHT domain-containing protein n=1 Tax=Penicillium capsulatum TaxID=69766 RepID=A0A9W9LGZ7_9EURO|nr:hypothetical protein N7492_008652 [Penicillium capsulatum]KAJ6106056.1 hypothetical protein N7512_009573 [Penicillium capsulatum]
MNTVNGQIEASRRGQWKIRTRAGKEYPVRDLFQSIAQWIQKFKELGDAAVAFDPTHAGVPWAAIRFLLDAGIDEVEKYSSIFEGVGIVSEFITRYGEVERKQLRGTSTFKTQLAEKLVKLYVAALEFLADAKHFYSMSTKKRVAKSFIPSTKPAPDQRLASVEKIEAEVRSILDRVETENQEISLSTMGKQMNNVGRQIDKDRAIRLLKSIAQRLSVTYTQDIYERALGARHEGTATWILENETFTAWMRPDLDQAKFLWIHGPPGFGKSILSASIIEYLDKELSRSPAYFFCLAENVSKRDPYAILPSWIAQLIEKDIKAATCAARLVKEDQYHPLTRKEQWNLFQEICRAIPHLTFVIDGYDECTSQAEQEKFNDLPDTRSQFLSDLIDRLNGTKAHVLLMSRDTAEIRAVVLESPISPGVAVTEYGIQPADTTPDVQSFSRYQIESNFKTKKSTDFDGIATMATEKADGMFLWVRLMAFKIKPTTTLKGLNNLVSTMPKGLEDTYQRDIDRIWNLDEDERDRALSILRWVLFATRPLTVLQLVEVLALDDDEEYPEDSLPDWWEDDKDNMPEDYVTDLLRRPLGSLIQLQPPTSESTLGENTVHLVHYSVKEFFLHQKPSARSLSGTQSFFHDPPTENGLLARICLRYLCLDVFDIPGEIAAADLQEKIKVYPFLSYAANQWQQHQDLEDKGFSSETGLIIKRLLRSSRSNWNTVSRIRETDQYFNFKNEKEGPEFLQEKLNSWKPDFPGGPLSYACELGFMESVVELVEEGADINVPGGMCGCPLHEAVSNGKLETARYLLEKGADMFTPRGMLQMTAIFWASFLKHPDVFLLLLEYGPDVGLRSPTGSTILHEAVSLASPEAVRIILRQGPDINAVDSQGGTALAAAAGVGNIEILTLLLEAGADANMANGEGQTPLFLVVLNESQMTLSAKVLLKHTSNVNHRDHHHWTVAHRAALGRVDLLSLLIENGADLNAVEDTGRTPLFLAVAENSLSCLNLLLEQNVDVNHREEDDWTALHFAAHNDQLRMAEALLDAGADIEALMAPAFGQNPPLLRAAWSGSAEVADLLIRRGANTQYISMRGNMAFDMAPRSDATKFSMFFWRNCVSLPTVEDESRLDELLRASFQKDCTRFEDLLASLVPKSTQWTQSGLLHITIIADSLEIVRLLLDWGADPNFALPNGRIPMHYAALIGNLDVIKLLAERGSSFTATDNQGLTPLYMTFHGGLGACQSMQFLMQHEWATDSEEPAPTKRLEETCKEILLTRILLPR